MARAILRQIRANRRSEEFNANTERQRREDVRLAKCDSCFREALRCRLSVHALRDHRALAAAIADGSRGRR